MSQILKRLARRRCYKVQLSEDPADKVFLRALTIGEAQALESLNEELSLAYTVGTALVNDVGEPEIPRQPGESHEQFAVRALLLLQDVATDFLPLLANKVRDLSAAPPLEDLVKN